MHDRVTICGGVLGGHPRLVADEILALSVANCRSTWRWRDGSSARLGPHEKARCKKTQGADRQRVSDAPFAIRAVFSVAGSRGKIHSVLQIDWPIRGKSGSKLYPNIIPPPNYPRMLTALTS